MNAEFIPALRLAALTPWYDRAVAWSTREAAMKARASGMEARLLPGWSHALPLPEASFDVAVSTLFFHHLQPHAKHQTVQELRRVLRPGGRLVVADFGRADARWCRGMFHLVRLLDGYPNTRDHAAGRLATYLIDGGFVDVQSPAPLPVPLGSIDFLVATQPSRA